MAADKKKLLQLAQKLTQKGQIEKAIEEYKKILQIDPNDVKIHNILGDLYVRVKKQDEGISEYLKVAELYEKDGFTLRAIAIYKKVMNQAPSKVETTVKLAELYTKQGLVAEAKSQYLNAADNYDKQGNVRKALDIFQKIADLDPQNVNVRIKLANTYEKEGLKEKSLAEFVKAAKIFAKRGKPEESLNIYKKILKSDPACLEAHKGLGNIFLNREEYKAAIQEFQYVKEKEPENMELLELLGKTYLKNNQFDEAEPIFKHILELDPKIISIHENLGIIYKEKGLFNEAFSELNIVADEHIQKNELDLAEKIYQELIEVDSQNIKAHEKLVTIYEKDGNGQNVISEFSKIAEIYSNQGLLDNALNVYTKLLELDPENVDFQSKHKQIALQIEKEPSIKPSVPSPEAVSEEEKIAPVEEVIEEPVEEIPPVERISEELDAELAMEEKTTPIEEVTKEPVEEEIISPIEKIAEELDEELAEEEKITSIKEPLEELVEEPVPEIELTEEDKQSITEKLTEVDVYLKYGLIDKAITQLQSLIEQDPQNIDIHQKLKIIYQEEGLKDKLVEENFIIVDIYNRNKIYKKSKEILNEILKINPENEKAKSALETISSVSLETVTQKIEPIQEELKPELIESEEEIITNIPEEEIKATIESILSEEEIPFEEKVTPDTYEEDLAEADFYFQQGLYNEAIIIYQKILTANPENQGIKDKIDEIAKKQEISEVTVSEQETEEITPLEKEVEIEEVLTPQPEKTTDEFLDFLSDIKGEFEEEKVTAEIPEPTHEFEEESLQDIFQEFRAGVEKQLDEKDFETHYNLGIAYKEMELINEAIDEFRLAAKEPKRFMDCRSLIGLCLIQNGMYDEAINEFKKGLETPNHTEEEYTGLRYDLGQAYEATGKLSEALDTYYRVYTFDSSFRDVGDKIKELKINLEDKKETIPVSKEKKKNKVSYI